MTTKQQPTLAKSSSQSKATEDIDIQISDVQHTSTPSPTQSIQPNIPPASQVHSNRLIRWLFLFLGTLFFILGVVGIVLPVLPTTPFVLLAAACWAKGSDKFHHWLINHRLFGKMVIDWQQKRAIPRYGKYLAWTMMTASCVMLFYRLQGDWAWLAWLTAAICLATAIWMARLPDA